MLYYIAFLAAFGLTYLVRHYALKKSLLAEVNARSSHTTPTPHGGGVAIALAWFGGLLYLYMYGHIAPPLFFALLWGVLLCGVSFLDDLIDLKPRIRLGVQVVVALGGLFSLGGFHTLTLGIFDISNPLLTTLFALLLILWYINLYNFLDGIDGYAGSEGIFLALAGLVLFSGAHFGLLAGCILGFLVWNWHKAKIFMGDVGSTLLGYNVAIFTLYYANLESNNLWVWIVLFGLFWADATVTLLRRFLRKEKLSQAHKKHAYQRLVQAGWRHDSVALGGMGVNVLLLGMAVFFPLWVSVTCSLLSLGLVLVFVEKQKRFASC